jgi:hypothetical protein
MMARAISSSDSSVFFLRFLKALLSLILASFFCSSSFRFEEASFSSFRPARRPDLAPVAEDSPFPFASSSTDSSAAACRRRASAVDRISAAEMLCEARKSVRAD